MVTPTFLLTVNGKDVTSSIKENLIKLEVTDYANLKSDEMVLEVLGAFNIPKEDDRIELWIGYEETGVWFVGSYIVQALPFNQTSTTVRATSTDFTKKLKEKNTKAYKEKSVKEIVEEIAGRNQLSIKCDILEPIVYMLQKDESDLHFLTRLAKEYGAIFKIKKDIMVFYKKEETRKIFLSLSECSSYSGEWKKREKYSSVECKWHDSIENKAKSVTAGSGEPILTIEEYFIDEAAAQVRAEKELAEQQRKEFAGSLSIYGQDIVAGAKLLLYGDSRIEGKEFSVTKVTHSLGSGYVVGVEFEG